MTHNQNLYVDDVTESSDWSNLYRSAIYLRYLGFTIYRSADTFHKALGEMVNCGFEKLHEAPKTYFWTEEGSKMTARLPSPSISSLFPELLVNYKDRIKEFDVIRFNRQTELTEVSTFI